ncbi:hypothetical protein V2J09_011084 [Rumex salicifolius]
MTRRCSHCSNNGHNSRTCPSRSASGVGSSGVGGSGGLGGLGGGGVKLFGVRLTDGSFIKKSASMGNLMHYHSAAASSTSPNAGSPSSDPPQDPTVPLPDGYLSDDPNHASCSSNRRAERKKGTPWTAEEHRLFLFGLQKLGKGDWRGISRNFVVSRTPTQVASHAQKFFIRQSNAFRRKRRSSLFDMVPDMDTDPQPVPELQILAPQPPHSAEPTSTNTNTLPSLDLSLGTEAAEPEPMETTSSEQADEEPSDEAQVAALPLDYEQSVLPTLFPAFIPYPFPFWAPGNVQTENNVLQATTSNHKVLKPTPMIPKEPVNVDDLVGLSKLKLSEAEPGYPGPPQLSLNVLGAPSRQSAFHASTTASFNSTDLTEGKNK